MARYLLILFMFLSARLSAGHEMLIIFQDDPAFYKDVVIWEQFFVKRYPAIITHKVSDFMFKSTQTVFYNVINKLSTKDTFVLILTAHNVPNEYGEIGEKAALVLKNSEDLFENRLIWQKDLQAWLKFIEDKQIRSLLIVNTCQPKLLLNPFLLKNFRYISTIISTNKDYSIQSNQNGSLLGYTLLHSSFNTLNQAFTICKSTWLDKRLYIFDTSKDIYPIEPVIYGPDFTF